MLKIANPMPLLAPYTVAISPYKLGLARAIKPAI